MPTEKSPKQRLGASVCSGVALLGFISLATACRNQATSDIDVTSAMKMVYGNYDGGANRSTMTMAEPSPDARFAKNTRMSVQPIFNTLERADGVDRFTLVTAAIPRDEPFDCHACSPIIGMAVFTRSGSGWKVEASSQQITNSGAWGKPPDDIRSLKIGPDRYAIQIMDTGEGQGETTRVLVLLVPWMKTVNLALERILADDDAGMCGQDAPPCYANQRSIAFKTTDHTEYYEIELRLSGTDLKDAPPFRLVQVHGLERLTLLDGKYQQLSRQGDLTTVDRVVADREGLK